MAIGLPDIKLAICNGVGISALAPALDSDL